MNKVMGVKMSKEVERLVKDRMGVLPEPYKFNIKGKSGMGYDRGKSAEITFSKIKKWAEREGAEVNLINDYDAVLVIEVTDPCARIIESILI